MERRCLQRGSRMTALVPIFEEHFRQAFQWLVQRLSLRKNDKIYGRMGTCLSRFSSQTEWKKIASHYVADTIFLPYKSGAGSRHYLRHHLLAETRHDMAHVHFW